MKKRKPLNLPSPMTSLPSDIIKVILCRLTVKDLLRYRSVCKQWYFLIDGPDFIKMHLDHHSLENTNCVIVTGNCHLFWVDNLHSLKPAVELTNPLEPLANSEGGTMVIGSCNGLLALRTRQDLAFWNPSTRRFRKLPKIAREYIVVYGFGHDPVNDDYKLVRLTQSESRVHSKIQVYSAKSKFWKMVVRHDINNYYISPLSKGVLLSNLLHWVVSRKPNNHLKNQRFPLSRIIISFHLVTEESNEVLLPDCQEKRRHIDVGVIGTSLCVIFNYVKDNSPVLNVWVMKEYGIKESWTKLFVLMLVIRHPCFPITTLVASSKKNGRDKVILILEWNELAWYDLERKMAEETLVVCDDCAPFSTHMCVESLVGLESTNNGKLSWKQVKENPIAKKSEEYRMMHDKSVGLCFMKA